MAVRIYSNPLSVQTQNTLGGVKGTLNKSIERISSGRRLNSASDDASGFAVSQKLKAQITGLAMANRNSQDGVSYLQTAEGGLDIMGQMVGRMRELAVQASNGVYTTTDRAELQKEVDQLKSEVDRVSNSTEFNTKKLLNGESTALTSTDTDKIKTTVKGQAVEGSYEVKVETKVGNGQVYQSAIFRTNSDEFSATLRADDKQLKSHGTHTDSVFMVGTDKDLIGSMNFATTSASYTMKIAASTGTAKATAFGIGVYMGQGSTYNTKTTAIKVTNISSMNTGYMEIRVTQWDAAGINALENKAKTALDQTHITSNKTIEQAIQSGLARIEYRFHDAKTGADTGWHLAKVTAGASAALVITMSGKGDAFNGFNIGMKLSVKGTDSHNISLQVGDVWGVAVQGQLAKADPKQGGFALSVQGGADGHLVAGPGASAGAVKPLQVVYGNGELAKRNNMDEVQDYGRARIYMGSMDTITGEFHFGAVDAYIRENSAANSVKIHTGTTTFSIQAGGSGASQSTKLSQLANFVTSDGRHIFAGHNTSQLSVYSAEGKHADVTLVGDDTLHDVDNKLTTALIKLGLGAGMHDIDTSKYAGSVISTVARINNQLVNFVDAGETAPSGANNTPSTFVFQAARVGHASTFSIVGDEPVVNGFGIKTAVEGHDSAMIVTAKNLSTGEMLKSNHILDGVYRGIENVDLHVDGGSGSYVAVNSTNNTLYFKPMGGAQVYHVSVQNNATKLQVGANEGQNFDISVPELNTKSMGIQDAFVFNQDMAQKAISKFDTALKQISSVRATIGAQINRLNFTSTNLGTMRQSLVASNSRIEDADIAEETSQYQRNQVLSQAATSMLSQANSQSQSALSLLQS